MTSPNGLVCFTNCLLPLEDGSLVERNLWIDERRGVILDSQVCLVFAFSRPPLTVDVENILPETGSSRQSGRPRRQHPQVRLVLIDQSVARLI